MPESTQPRLLCKNRIQDWVGLLCLLGMVLGFVMSRAVLSISMIVLFVNAFWPLQWKQVWNRWRSSFFAILCTAYFLINFIGGLWSEKQDVWLDIVVLNLPFLVLPLGMMTIPLDKELFRKYFLIGLYGIILGVISVSLASFFSDMNDFIQGYDHSKTIPTIEENDHIRFSLFLTLSLLPGIAYFNNDTTKKSDRNFRFFLILALSIIIIYLHILSAKTGLLALYFLFGFLVFQYFYNKGHKLKSLIIPPMIVVSVFVIGYFTIATMQKKIDYVAFEIEEVASGKPLDYNYSDAGRLISYQIALDQFTKNALIGVGTGDIMTAMRSGYTQMYPEVPIDNQLIPHNQYLYVLLAFGVLFFPVFLLLTVIPFFARLGKSQSYLNASTAILVLAMMVEAMLQVQLGVFVYLYFICIWFRWRYADRLPQ